MSENLLKFLTDMALVPATHAAYQKDADAAMKNAGLDENERQALTSKDHRKISDLIHSHQHASRDDGGGSDSVCVVSPNSYSFTRLPMARSQDPGDPCKSVCIVLPQGYSVKLADELPIIVTPAEGEVPGKRQPDPKKDPKK